MYEHNNIHHDTGTCGHTLTSNSNQIAMQLHMHYTICIYDAYYKYEYVRVRIYETARLHLCSIPSIIMWTWTHRQPASQTIMMSSRCSVRARSHQKLKPMLIHAILQHCIIMHALHNMLHIFPPTNASARASDAFAFHDGGAHKTINIDRRLSGSDRKIIVTLFRRAGTSIHT